MLIKENLNNERENEVKILILLDHLIDVNFTFIELLFLSYNLQFHWFN